MDSSAMGSVISGLFSLGGQFASNASNARQNRKNRNFQEQENEKARRFAREQYDTMWRDQTQWEQNYNSPKAQMARLKEANINPHMAYQNGSPMNTSNVNPSMPSPSGVSALPPGRPSQWNLESMGDLAVKFAQAKNLDADTESKKANTKNTEVITGMNAVDLENKVNLVTQENEQRGVNIQATKAGINLTNEKVQQTTQEIVNLATSNDKIKQEIDNLVVQKGLNETQIVQLWATVANIKATNDLIKAQTANTNADSNLKNEKSKTEGLVRSNLAIDASNKSEVFKKYTRENQVGDKYDMSNAENKYKLNDASAKRAYNLVKASEIGNKMGELKLTEQEYINIIRLFESAGAPANTFQQYKDAINPLNGRTTTHFDQSGDYRGHTTTRNHR